MRASSNLCELAAGVVIREYKDGTLLREDAISQEHLEAIFGPMKDAAKKRRIRKAKTKVRAQALQSSMHAHSRVEVNVAWKLACLAMPTCDK